MEENKSQQLTPLQMSKPVIQALFMKELPGYRYNEILQGANDLTFSKDNLSADYPALKELDRLIKLLDDLRKQIKNPYDVVAKDIQSVFSEIIKPLEEIRDQKKADLRKANEQAIEEKKKAVAEHEKRAAIKENLVLFINNVTLLVGNAKTDKEIARVQQLVGTEKSKKNFYGEYYEELSEKCALLEEPIRLKKDFIRQNAEKDRQMRNALSSGDYQKAADLKQEQDVLQEKISESAVVLQEAAFHAATSVEMVVAEPMIETVKPRSKRWTWRIDDINLLHKKMPHLVRVVPNEEAIEVLLKSKRAEKELKDEQELNVSGLVFYQEKYY